MRCGRQITEFAVIAAHRDYPAEGSAGSAGAADTSGAGTADAGAGAAHLGDKCAHRGAGEMTYKIPCHLDIINLISFHSLLL